MSGHYVPPSLREKRENYLPPSLREKKGNATAGNNHGNTLPDPNRYIPPFLRNRDANAASTKEEAKTPLRSILRSAREIRQYYSPGEETPSHEVATLHDSARTPGILTYVLIFHEANPRWPHDRIIFAKTNLDFLPVDVASDCTPPPGNVADDELPKPAGGLDSESKSTLVTVFEQMKRPPQAYHSSGFEFTGYFRIAKVAFLEPRSPDLKRMLEQKFSHTDRWGETRAKERSKASWEASLDKRWAVIKFEKDEVAHKEIGAPSIPELWMAPAASRDEGKSVNELLKESRMKDLDGGHGDEENAAQD